MKKRLVVLCMFVAALSLPLLAASAAEVSPAIASSPICYMVTQEIKDESAFQPQSAAQQSLREAIEGYRFTWGASVAVPTGAGSRREPGRASQETFVITKLTSASTPKLFEAVLLNRPIREAIIYFVRPGGQGGLENYYTLKLSNVSVTSVHQYSDGSRLFEDVSLAASAVEITSAKKGGGGNVQFKYDSTKMPPR